MGFWKRTVKEYDLHGKQVLLRADYNVPIDESGNITDDYRITQSLPTLQYLLEQACSIVIISHLGRPKDEYDKKCSLEPIAKRLAEKFNREVKFAQDCVGEDAKQKVSELQPGDILLLENLRFHKEEEANSDSFAKELAGHGEVFAQDGFGVVHRAHASTDAITKHLPSVAGLLLEREVGTIADGMNDPARPLMAIIGGAKVSDKIDVLRRFVEHADVVAIGGAMANVFLQARGIPIGNSKASAEDLPLAREIIEMATKRSSESDFIFYLPQDAVVAKEVTPRAETRIVDWGSHVFADIEAYPGKPNASAVEISDDDMMLDIGPYSGAFIAGTMQLSKTVIWNGAMGVTEVQGLQGPVGPFSHGTDTIVRSCSGEFGNRPHSIVGGGDTVGYLENTNTLDRFSHVSTGGGASLELMSGNQLPGVESLWDKE